MVRTYQEQAEQARKREDEERRQKMEMVKRRKRMLEAAFDGNNADILAILKEVFFRDSLMSSVRGTCLAMQLVNQVAFIKAQC